MYIDLSKTSGASPPALGDFPAHLFGPQDAPRPTPPRFHISDDLWNGYSVEQVAKHKARLIETGRWLLPNGGGEYVVRLTIQALRPVFKDVPVEIPESVNAQLLYDFEFDGNEYVDTTCVFKKRYSGCPYSERQAALEEFAAQSFSSVGWSSRTFIAVPKWWDGEWMCFRLHSTLGEETAETVAAARDVLIMALQDRSVQKIEAEPRKPSKLWKLGIGKKRHDDAPSDTREITLYCPRRVSTANHGGTHASPKMHFRAEHTRQQPYGPRKSPSYREIVIEGTWINAADVDVSELGTPIKLYKLVGGE
jgi:hypothetical protein